MAESGAQDQRADTLEDAWANFDPDIPVPAGSPFFVQQEPPPLGALRQALLQRHPTPPKYFLASFKGAGKSSQLNQLAIDTALQQKYFVAKFTIRETCDERNIDYVDLLVALGSRLFISFKESGGRLNPGIYAELQAWGRKVEERISERGAGTLVEAGAGAGLDWLMGFFAKITAKVRAEQKSRTVIRELLEPQVNDLVGKINLLAAGIQAATQKEVLVLVDDTDKPFPEQARALFKDHLAPLLDPNLSIVYTAPVWALNSPEFPDLREPRAFLLPNISLYPRRGDRSAMEPQAEATMRDFVFRRTAPGLIEEGALTEAFRMSGGVFSELARIMHMAISHALERKEQKLSLDSVRRATAALRRQYRRICTALSPEELAALRSIAASRSYGAGQRVSGLLDNLLVLEYLDEDEENWPDVNPLLPDLIS